MDGNTPLHGHGGGLWPVLSQHKHGTAARPGTGSPPWRGDGGRATHAGYSEGLHEAANRTAPLPGGCEHQLKIHRGKQPLWLRLITFLGEEGNVRVSSERLKTATAFARCAAAAGGTRGAPGGGIARVGVTRGAPAAAPRARPRTPAPGEPDLEWDALQRPILGCSRLRWGPRGFSQAPGGSGEGDEEISRDAGPGSHPPAPTP